MALRRPVTFQPKSMRVIFELIAAVDEELQQPERLRDDKLQLLAEMALDVRDEIAETMYAEGFEEEEYLDAKEDGLLAALGSIAKNNREIALTEAGLSSNPFYFLPPSKRVNISQNKNVHLPMENPGDKCKPKHGNKCTIDLSSENLGPKSGVGKGKAKNGNEMMLVEEEEPDLVILGDRPCARKRKAPTKDDANGQLEMVEELRRKWHGTDGYVAQDAEP